LLGLGFILVVPATMQASTNGYNITIGSQASNIRYHPARNGPIEESWNLTYSQTNDFTLKANGIGVPSRRTTHAGAKIEMDWFGTAAYLFGFAKPSTYCISVDGGEEQDGQPAGELLGKVEGLEYGNHTLSLEVVDGGSSVEFKQALLTVQSPDTQ
jgi:hypothetical protein